MASATGLTSSSLDQASFRKSQSNGANFPELPTSSTQSEVFKFEHGDEKETSETNRIKPSTSYDEQVDPNQPSQTVAHIDRRPSKDEEGWRYIVRNFTPS
jgi:hypothetical protein